ncbi:MAG: M20/M25/M40 family metallo-hydrolase [bacterium]|nr:M20/M25/M40 family metallo-hydrolase [candidate division KSB1 bacterium]MDH7559028.1 M20/M25/M40 family metallo-hydrolase [bacterium]
MKRTHAAKATLILVVIALVALPLVAQELPNGETAKSYVTYLASDALQGRDTGTPGFAKAAAWVAAHFREWGLQPGGDNGTYFQEFPFEFYQADIEVPTLRVAGRPFSFQEEDFRVMAYSGGGKVGAEVVFVGYGISAPEKGLDEYAGVNTRGKVVLLMHGCPGDQEAKWGALASDSAKAAMAVQHGAVGMLMCAHFRQEDRSAWRWRLRPGNYKPGFLAFAVSDRVAQFLLIGDKEAKRQFDRRMRAEQEKLDKELKPMSHTTGKKAELSVKVVFDPNRKGKNVIAVLPGSDPQLREEAIVLGGHLDHVGVQYGEVYNGADDNASGAATVLEVARVMARNGVQPRRSIVFACWGGEERGLLGSRYYAEHPRFPIEKTVANLNMDMVGLGKKLGFPGIYYAPELWGLIRENLTPEELEFIEASRGGPGGSDHTPFITRGVPAFALMTSPFDAHPNYHHPSDDAEKIDAELMGKVARFVYKTALLLADHEGELIVEKRLPRYIHKSAVVANLHPLPYTPGMAVLDSLQDEWIDLQFVSVPFDSLLRPSDQLVNVVRSLEQASKEVGDPSRLDRAMAMMFSSRREKTAALVGLDGARTVHGDLQFLAVAGKLGARFLVLNGCDGTWITRNGLTEEGKQAVAIANEQKMLLILQNLPESVICQVVAASKAPVVVAGVAAVSDSVGQKLKENGALLAVPYDPAEGSAATVAKLRELREQLGPKSLTLYPDFGQPLRVAELDRMLELTIALKEEGWAEREITDLLGGNLREVLGRIFPSAQPRMMRPF